MPVETIIGNVGLTVHKPFCVRIIQFTDLIIGRKPVKFLGNVIPEFVWILDKFIISPSIIPHPAVHAVGRVGCVISGLFPVICAFVHDAPLIYIINNDELKLIFAVRMVKFA